MKSNRDAYTETITLLNTCPYDDLSQETKDLATKWIEDGHPAEYYAGVMRGLMEAALMTRKKKRKQATVEICLLSVGVAVRWRESCPMEVK
jgi:hypothetical protein